MYYFKVQPALPFTCHDHGGHKLRVYKSTRTISVCGCTSPSISVVKSIIKANRVPSSTYEIHRVNEKYFKLATICKRKEIKREETIGDTFKILISKSGKKLSQWILDLTKYD